MFHSWNKFSIKLSVIILLLTLIPLVGFGFFTQISVKKALTREIERANNEVAFSSIKMAETAISDIQKAVDMVLDITALNDLETEDQEWVLLSLIKSHPEILSFSLLDRMGNEILKLSQNKFYLPDDLSNRTEDPAFKAASQGEKYIGPVHMTDKGNRLMLLSLPLFNPDMKRIDHVLVMEITLQSVLGNIISRKINSNGRVYIIARDGQLIAHPDFSLVLAGTNFSSYPVFKSSQNGKLANKIQTYNDYTQTNTIGLGKVSKKLQWVFVVEQSSKEAFASMNILIRGLMLTLIIIVLLILGISLILSRWITTPLLGLEKGSERISQGDFDQKIPVLSNDEIGRVTQTFNQMIQSLRDNHEKIQQQTLRIEQENWLKTGQAELSKMMQGDLSLEELSQNVIRFLSEYINAVIGAFYVVKDTRIKLIGSYAFRARNRFRNECGLGEGMVGQAALGKRPIVINDVPDDYIAIGCSLGETTPSHLTIIPLIWNNEVVVLLEFGSIATINPLHERLIEMVSTAISTAVKTSLGRDQTIDLLEQTQAQTEELQVREEELKDQNILLEKQSLNLKRSQAELEEKNEQLQGQQEELRVANDELENKAADLAYSRQQLEQNNRSLEDTKKELEQRAEELGIASKYKSEFLANMSHELRTPLNSLLVLAKLLANNKDGNLTEKQVDYSLTIFESGNDLHTLINEILDLSKIESGKEEVHIESILLNSFVTGIQRKFDPMAKDKGIHFDIDTRQAPDTLVSDARKLDQIVKNLLSNAIKFTDHGQVSLTIAPLKDDTPLNKTGVNRENALAFTVTDSGIGVPEEKLDIIFEAFKQADGTTSRKHGGTGLGLSISRELARLLGGEIRVKSEKDVGSTFTLILPDKMMVTEPEMLSQTESLSPVTEKKPKPISKPMAAVSIPVPEQSPVSIPSEVPDDRKDLKPGDRSILIIEDDVRFARIVADIARERDFGVLVAEDGNTGLHFAEFYLPSGIVLDVGLPGMDGWKVIEHLKANLKTRHIPVHFMSALDNDNPLNVMKKGAIGFLSKPVSLVNIEHAFKRIESIVDQSVKRLLLIEDNRNQLNSLCALIGSSDVEITSAESGSKALRLLSENEFDCIILDLGLPDMSGLELLEKIRTREKLHLIPIIVYTGKELEPRERMILDRYAQSIIVKDVRSPERLLDDTALFLHRIESELPEEQRDMIRMLHDPEMLFVERKVLVVDDDMRNAFSLSAVLHEKKMQVLTACNGFEALEQLDSNPDIDIVLMDIMMPEMDGYEATRKIREQKRFADLPIIALTAKAMKGDRTLCIEAGANDYVAKPMDTDKLLSVMRVWLYR